MRSAIILPSSGTIDLYDENPLSLTYQIADIKEPQKRHSDYSKTITIPGTANNNKRFVEIFEIGVDRLFNPNKKAQAVLTIDSVSIMKGWLRLRNIKVIDKKIEYECEITGRTADIFTAISDSIVQDISWTDLDHTYSRANQIASWVAAHGNNYVYPFIDYGYSQNEIDYHVEHFFPAVYVKELIDRIFSFAGFQYSSTFLTSAYFKNLIIPCNKDKLTLTTVQVNNRRFRASRTTDQSFTIPNATFNAQDIIFNNDTTSPNQDTGGVYDTATGIWTCGGNGLYNVNINFIVKSTSTGAAGPCQQTALWFRIIDITNSPREIEILNGYYPFVNNSTNQISISISTATPVFISNGTQIKVQIISTESGCSPSPTVSVLSGGYFEVSIAPEIKENDTLSFANILPDKLKMRDVLISVIKMFNLYFEYDKDVPNKIYIEPRDDYYNATIQDWSDKIDVSKELQIIPLGALQAKEYQFSYKEDGDYLNKLYKDIFGETYGEKRKKIDNDFLTSVQREEVIFSPTPQWSSSAMAQNIVAISFQDRYFPKIIQVDSNGIPKPRTSNIRILQYNGVKSCKPWNYESRFNATSGVTNYPECGHMDDFITPTQDINWSVPKEVFYKPAFNAVISNNNLYNKYWKREIDEITDINSSIVVGYFHLVPKDIAMLDFRNIFHFNEQNFRLNKIYDYNPLSTAPVKCEFLKLKLGIPFCASTVVAIGISDDATGKFTNASCGSDGDADEKPPLTISSIVMRGGNSYNPFVGNVVVGKNNIIPPSASKIMIIGDYNRVGENSENVSMINSSGCIAAGKNISIYNSSGVTVSEDNTRVERNITTFSPTIGATTGIYEANISLGSASIKTLNTIPVDFIDAPGSNKAIEVISASLDFTAGAIAFDNTQVRLLTDTAGTQQATATGLNSATNIFVKFGLSAASATTSLVVNKKLTITSNADSTTSGNGRAKIYCVYKIIDI